MDLNLQTNGGNLVTLLSNYIGETVTIFTASGGQSGSGFTGVLLAVTPTYVRLITQIGPAPGCALGNSCMQGYQTGGYNNYSFGNYVNNVGSVTDIPTQFIVSFVHNAV